MSTPHSLGRRRQAARTRLLPVVNLRNMNQSLRMQLLDNSKQIVFESLRRNVVLIFYDGEDFLQRAVLLDERPDASSHFIQTEVDSGLQVEDNCLSFEIAGHYVVRNLNEIPKRKVFDLLHIQPFPTGTREVFASTILSDDSRKQQSLSRWVSGRRGGISRSQVRAH